MATVPGESSQSAASKRLYPGARMEQKKFHVAYKAMPDSYRAELVGGIVYEPSPVGYPHGNNHVRLCSIIDHYAGCTPGIEAADGATVILSNKDEVQPDLLLRAVPKHVGRSEITQDKYIAGPPELLVEVAHSSRDFDLGLKKKRYAKAGVIEYIVLCIEPKQLHWFDLAGSRELLAGADGIFRSAIFPGLWIDGNALLDLDYGRSMEALDRGMKTEEYAQFLKRLTQAENG